MRVSTHRKHTQTPTAGGEIGSFKEFQIAKFSTMIVNIINSKKSHNKESTINKRTPPKKLQ